MLVENQLIKVTWRNGKTRKHYEEKGYLFTKSKDTFLVRPIDLPKNSTYEVKVICDYCLEKGIKNEFTKLYHKYNNQRSLIQKDCCKACRKIKQEDVMELKYGVRNNLDKKKNLDKILNTTRKDFDCIKDRFKNSECTLLTVSEEYNNNTTPLTFVCKKHKEIGLQKRKWTHIKSKNDHICIYCIREDAKLKISIKNIGKNKGKDNGNWKDGVTSENDKIRKSMAYKNWRQLVFQRDNFICQCCRQIGGKLNAHHIDSFADYEFLRIEVSNGITMCEQCHSANIKGSFHHTYGTFNNNIYQLQEYFNDIQLALNISSIRIEDIISKTI